MKPLFLLFLWGLVLFGQQPKLYRWKDPQGKEHVTNTPPPGGAVPLDVPPLENKKEPEHQKSTVSLPPAKAPRGLTTIEEGWRSLGLRLREARIRGDRTTLDHAANKVATDALWGDGLWALMFLPVAALALVTLLGWWGGGALRGVAGHLVTVLFLLAGIGLAHFCLGRFVYKAQAQRLRSAAAALQAQLVEPGTMPNEGFRALEIKGAALEDGLTLSAPPWRFPNRVAAFKEALVRAVANP